MGFNEFGGSTFVTKAVTNGTRCVVVTNGGNVSDSK